MEPVFFVSTVLAILVAFAAIRYARRFISSQDVKGQLDAKDAVIATNEQTIDSFEKRISTLESEMSQLQQELSSARERTVELQSQLDVAVARYRELEKYAAPNAVERFEETLVRFEAILLERIDALTRSLEDHAKRDILREGRSIQREDDRILHESHRDAERGRSSNQ